MNVDGVDLRLRHRLSGATPCFSIFTWVYNPVVSFVVLVVLSSGG